jgi:hypothetical protein
MKSWHDPSRGSIGRRLLRMRNRQPTPRLERRRKGTRTCWLTGIIAKKQWTLRDRPLDKQGNPDPYQTVLASPDAVDLMKGAARIAVSQLRRSRENTVRALAASLREPLYVWLDLMREKERGFRRITELTRWRGGKSIEEFQRSGTLPTDARITESGTIPRLLQESDAFWRDLIAFGFDSEPTVTSDHSKPPVVGLPPSSVEPLPETIAAERESNDSSAGQVASDDEITLRAKNRTAWLDQKLAERDAWTSDKDIEVNGGPAYNTIQRYRSGTKSTRDLYVRKQLARTFDCPLSDVPD